MSDATIAQMKQRAAEYAVHSVASGMVVGLGHGTTALAERLQARAGIVAHGLFLGLATEVIVADQSGIRTLP